MPETIEANSSGTGRDVKDQMGLVHINYGLHALAPFTFWTLAIVAVIIGYVKRPDVSGTYLESHYGWLSRTFWWGILWAVLAWTIFAVGTFLTLGVGFFIFWIFPAIVFVWYLYRVIRGWLRLSDQKPAP